LAQGRRHCPPPSSPSSPRAPQSGKSRGVMGDEGLLAATRSALEALPPGSEELMVRKVPLKDMVEAGPKALLAAVQAGDTSYAAVGLHKFKKVLAKARAAMAEELEQARIEAAKPKVGSKDNCPGRHGLTRFLTNHSSYCCDTCRCYLPQGAPMWGCRTCDWDVCEGRCHAPPTSIEALKGSIASLAEQVDLLQSEAPAGLRTKLALVEADVHKTERRLDDTSVQDIIAGSPLQMSEEEARTEKKALIKSSEALLARIEGIFDELKERPPDAARATADAGVAGAGEA